MSTDYAAGAAPSQPPSDGHCVGITMIGGQIVSLESHTLDGSLADTFGIVKTRIGIAN